MGQAEIIIFIVLANLILLIFIIGIVIFIFQYRKRKLMHNKEMQQVTEMHQIEILNTQIEMQQLTMQNIGREIHDNVGQKLTLAALYSQQMEFLNQFPEINERIENISSIINESLNDLRSLSRNLIETANDDMDVLNLIKSECDRVNILGVCKVEYDIEDNSIHTSFSVKRVVIRILQEFIQNSLKHAECSLIRIRTEVHEKSLTILAEDNGKGFVMKKQIKSKGIGLDNMTKRAELINAIFLLESKPGLGTYLKLVIPDTEING